MFENIATEVFGKNIELDTSSYEWFRHGKKPSGIDYYSFEVHYDGDRSETYSFHGDFKEGIRRVKEKYGCLGVTEIYVGV